MRELLRPVARSFSLNLRLLPGAMRQPLSLAYLLARLSDTVADAPGEMTGERLRLLQSLQENPGKVSASNPGFPVEASPGEMVLWKHWEALRDTLERSPWRTEIVRVWHHILEGQILDAGRLLEGNAHEPLEWAEVLNYADAVAGSVGEFWHCVGDKIWGDWSRWPREEAIDAAHCYGQALQLFNICRDAGVDARGGKQYLDEEDFPRAMNALREGLLKGKHYALGLGTWRLRWATLLPSAFANSLLPTLQSNPAMAKLTKSRARRVLFSALLRSWKRRSHVADAVHLSSSRSR